MFEILAERVKSLIGLMGSSDLAVITCGASLAYYGLLRSVISSDMWLTDFDLTSVPDEHLTSLVSSIQYRLYINNVSGRDLVSILDGCKSYWLTIKNQSLDSEETEALLLAMETNFARLQLEGGVTLDMETLVRYNGQGKCKRLTCINETATRYRKSLKTWAKRIDWIVTDKNTSRLDVSRLQLFYSMTPQEST